MTIWRARERRESVMEVDDMEEDAEGSEEEAEADVPPYASQSNTDRLLTQPLDNSSQMLEMMGSIKTGIGTLQAQTDSMNERISHLEASRARED